MWWSFLEHLHNCFGDIAKVEKLYTEPSLFYKPISRQCFISNSPNRLIYTEKYYLRSGKNQSCEDFKFFRLLLKRLLMVQCSNSHEMWELPYWPDSVQMNRNQRWPAGGDNDVQVHFVCILVIGFKQLICWVGILISWKNFAIVLTVQKVFLQGLFSEFISCFIFRLWPMFTRERTAFTTKWVTGRS